MKRREIITGRNQKQQALMVYLDALLVDSFSTYVSLQVSVARLIGFRASFRFVPRFPSSSAGSANAMCETRWKLSA